MLANPLGNTSSLQVGPPRHLGTSALGEKVRAAHSEKPNTERSEHTPVLEGGLSKKRKAGRHELGERPLSGQEGAVHRHRSSQQAGVISPSWAYGPPWQMGKN